MAVERLDELEGLAGGDVFFGGSFFAGVQVGFEGRVGLGKRRRSGLGEFGCGAICLPRRPQSL